MKNQVCPKPDCMYLHELGDSEASFTKEEMHQGKHQEYEKRLHDTLIAQMQQQSQQTTTSNGSNSASSSPVEIPENSGSSDSPENGIMKSDSAESQELSSSGGNNETTNNGQIQQEAWPSLSTSPVTIKENKTSVKGSE